MRRVVSKICGQEIVSKSAWKVSTWSAAEKGSRLSWNSKMVFQFKVIAYLGGKGARNETKGRLYKSLSDQRVCSGLESMFYICVCSLWNISQKLFLVCKTILAWCHTNEWLGDPKESFDYLLPYWGPYGPFQAKLNLLPQNTLCSFVEVLLSKRSIFAWKDPNGSKLTQNGPR